MENRTMQLDALKNGLAEALQIITLLQEQPSKHSTVYLDHKVEQLVTLLEYSSHIPNLRSVK